MRGRVLFYGGPLSDPSLLRSLLGRLTRWPSTKDLTVRVENLGLVSAPPKEKPIEPRPVDARNPNFSHKQSLIRFGGDTVEFRWLFSEIFLAPSRRPAPSVFLDSKYAVDVAFEGPPTVERGGVGMYLHPDSAATTLVSARVSGATERPATKLAGRESHLAGGMGLGGTPVSRPSHRVSWGGRI
jgi:hypothetical protein